MKNQFFIVSSLMVVVMAFQNCSESGVSLPSNQPPNPSQTPNPETTKQGEATLCQAPFHLFGMSVTEGPEKDQNGNLIKWCDLLETRLCINGSINGSNDTQKYAEPSSGFLCYIRGVTSISTRTCTVDGRTLNHGETSIFYRKALVKGSENCLGQLRTCNNGVLSGSTEYASASCGSSDLVLAEGAPRPCTFNGSSIAEGSITIAYRDPKPVPRPELGDPKGVACHFQVRHCIDGNLDQPDYQYSACKFGQ